MIMDRSEAIFSLIYKICLTYVMTFFWGTCFGKPVSYPPTTSTIYHYKSVATLDVILDPGYFITIINDPSIQVHQTSSFNTDPFSTYYGCGIAKIIATFPAMIKAEAHSTSSANGTWYVTLNNQESLALDTGITPVTICVVGMHVQTQMLIQSETQSKVPVAEIIIQAAPQ